MGLLCLWSVVFVCTCPEQVGQLQIPLLLVVGEDDQNWPAEESAMDVSERPVSWTPAEMWIYLRQKLQLLLSRWKKWWSELGTVTCWPSCLTQTPVTWSNLRTRPTSDPPPSEQQYRDRRVSLETKWHQRCKTKSGWSSELPVLPAAFALWGGEMVAHSWAQEDSWRKVLDFLRQNLYVSTASFANLWPWQKQIIVDAQIDDFHPVSEKNMNVNNL